MTPEEAIEVECLKNSDAVKLAQKEQRLRQREKKYLYQLRWYEKHGRELMKAGWTMENIEQKFSDVPADFWEDDDGIHS